MNTSVTMELCFCIKLSFPITDIILCHPCLLHQFSVKQHLGEIINDYHIDLTQYWLKLAYIGLQILSVRVYFYSAALRLFQAN